MSERLSGGADPAPEPPKEKESFSDASYIPRDEAPTLPRVYNYSSEEKDSRGRGTDEAQHLSPRGLAALCVSCVLLGLGIGTIHARQKTIDIAEPFLSAEPAGEEPTVPAPTAEPRPDIAEPALSAAEIYSAAGVQLVNITAGTDADEQQDLCTGFFVSGDGYVLTAGRPVQEALRQELALYAGVNGESYAVQVVGCEQETGDVAVLKLDISGQYSVSPGDSRRLTVGDEVCILSCTGEGRVLTLGTVAAPEGEFTADGAELLAITPAAGPLPAGSAVYNARGQVVGFLSDGYTLPLASAVAAVPIGDALPVVSRLTEAAPVQGQPRLGIVVQTVSEAVAEYYNQYGENRLVAGARVCAMADLSSAAFSGVKLGDIITALDNYVITSEADLARAEREYRVGESAVLTLRRGEETVALSVVFSAPGYPASDSASDKFFRSFPPESIR